MKKLKSMLRVLAVAAIGWQLAPVDSRAWAEPTTNPSADSLLTEKPLKDEKSAIQIRMPKGWVPKKEIQDTGYESPKRDSLPEGSLAPNIILSKADIKGLKPTDLPAILKANREQYAKMFPGFTDVVMDEQLPKITGAKVGAIDGTYKADNTIPIRIRQVWIIANDRAYIITCTSLQGTFEANDKAFMAAVNSVVVP